MKPLSSRMRGWREADVEEEGEERREWKRWKKVDGNVRKRQLVGNFGCG